MRTDLWRPDGQTLFSWSNGRYLSWDATVADTVAVSHLASTSIRARSATAEAEERRKAQYRDVAAHFAFAPVEFETFDAWGPEAIA